MSAARVNIFRGEVKFIAGAARINQLPKFLLPEIAFIGKSNVGKSTLINMICHRKSLARVSCTPGCTQQINFFLVAGAAILVDLPGYGFAKVPVRLKEQWQNLFLYYLHNRQNLKLVNLLIDARRGISDSDHAIINLLVAHNINWQIVLTKVDKINFTAQTIAKSKILLESLGHSCNVICTSSRSKKGAKELQYSVARSIKY